VVAEQAGIAVMGVLRQVMAGILVAAAAAVVEARIMDTTVIMVGA
jgi:hypothetical protein